MGFDYSDVAKRLDKVNNALKSRDRIYGAIAKELAEYLIARVTPRTPVYAPKSIDGNLYEAADGRKAGELRSRWLTDNTSLTLHHFGDTYAVVVRNDAEYASYVEEGHSQNVGQLFPVIVNGKKTYRRWRKPIIEGQYFLRLSESDLLNHKNSMISARIEKFLNEVLQ